MSLTLLLYQNTRQMHFNRNTNRCLWFASCIIVILKRVYVCVYTYIYIYIYICIYVWGGCMCGCGCVCVCAGGRADVRWECVCVCVLSFLYALESVHNTFHQSFDTSFHNTIRCPHQKINRDRQLMFNATQCLRLIKDYRMLCSFCLVDRLVGWFVSPWYDHRGWLGVKNQLYILNSISNWPDEECSGTFYSKTKATI